MKKVVAITLTCNRLEVTKKWLSQLKDKNDYPFNHIIVDNGSTDGTLEWLKSEGYEIISLNKNIGQIKALRIAWEYAKKKYDPDYYIKFDDDCEVLSDNMISDMVKFLNQCESYIIAPINIELEQEEYIKYMPKIVSKRKEKGHEVWTVSHTGGIVQMVSKKSINLMLGQPDDKLTGDMARCNFLGNKGIIPLFLYDLKVMHRGNDGQTKGYKL